MKKERRRIGDRRDGKLVRDLDALHFITSVIYPNRCDNEAFISERIDLTPVYEYVNMKNESNPAYKYNVFQVMVSAIQKVLIQRPLLNRFIANCNQYQRNYVSAGFIVKKEFSDEGGEALAIIKATESDTIDTIHEKIYHRISGARANKMSSTEKSMEIVTKLPRFISKAFIRFVMFLDRIGKCPKSFSASDPYYSSVMLTNLGSIKLKSGYHHLTNWGTTSLFIVVGEYKDYPIFDKDGNVTFKPMVDLGFTVDERIADGYYFSKSIKLFVKLMNNPSLLELPFSEVVED